VVIRRQRETRHLSQKEPRAKLKTSQPRIAKIERAATDGSLDQLVRAFAAAGGKLVVKIAKRKSAIGKSARQPPQGTIILEAAVSE
jgi:predicted transcriptional regulator